MSPTSLSCGFHISHFRSICFGLSHNKLHLRDSLPFGQMDWRCNILLLGWSESFSRHIHASIIRSALYLPHLHLTVLNLLIHATAPSPQSSSFFFFLPPSYTVSLLLLKLTDSSSHKYVIGPDWFQTPLIKRAALSGPLWLTHTHTPCRQNDMAPTGRRKRRCPVWS